MASIMISWVGLSKSYIQNSAKCCLMKTSRLYAYSLICRLLPETRCFGIKAKLLRCCGAKIGANVRISSSAKFLGGGVLEIGDDVWIGSDDMIHAVARASIKIGNCCDLGPGVIILTGSHKIDPIGVHIAGEGTSADVEVGDGCWLGARSMLLPGVKLPRKTLVAAGAVVTRSPIEEQTLIAGIPAQAKRTIVGQT